MNISILASAVHEPARTISSLELDAWHGELPRTIESKLNIRQRRYAGKTETADQMGYGALSSALKAVNLAIEDIDCLIAACGTPAQAIPYNAATIYRHFNSTRRIHTFDVNMTCLSFVQAFAVASMYLKTGKYKRIAVVSSEKASVGLDWTSLEASSIFGDGAAAFVFAASDDQSLLSLNPLSFKFETVHEAFDFCQIKGGGSSLPPSFIGDSFSLDEHKDHCTFKMDGRKLYRFVFKDLRPFVERHLAEHSLALSDIDLVIPHQASAHGLHHVKKTLELSDERFFDVFADYGNQVAASIPTALHLAIASGRAQPGMKILLLGTSAGMSFGSAILDTTNLKGATPCA